MKDLLDVAAENSKELVGGLSGEYPISEEAGYSWVHGMRNSWNGFLRERDLPEGKLLDFIDPGYHKLMVEEIYSMHPATGRYLTQWGTKT